MFLVEAREVASSANTALYLLGAVLGGGLLSGAASWYKLTRHAKIEKEDIISRAAEQAVNALRLSLVRLETELQQSKEERDRIQGLLGTAVEKRIQLEEKVKILSTRIGHLEKEVKDYKILLDKAPH